MNAARTFVHSYFLTRHVDIPGMLNFRNPKHVLGVEMRRLGLIGGIESRFVACDFSIDHYERTKTYCSWCFLQTSRRVWPTLHLTCLLCRALSALWLEIGRGDRVVPQDGRASCLHQRSVLHIPCASGVYHVGRRCEATHEYTRGFPYQIRRSGRPQAIRKGLQGQCRRWGWRKRLRYSFGKEKVAWNNAIMTSCSGRFISCNDTFMMLQRCSLQILPISSG